MYWKQETEAKRKRALERIGKAVERLAELRQARRCAQIRASYAQSERAAKRTKETIARHKANNKALAEAWQKCKSEFLPHTSNEPLQLSEQTFGRD